METQAEKSYYFPELPANLRAGILKRWQEHRFYQTDVVLGLDIGLKGIGVAVRKGSELVYAKTWMIDWPGGLEQRRAMRSARRCRKNRKIRMNRLRSLFLRHGLPWFDERDPALLHSNPFKLRYRAITGKLASVEALTLAIRHIVAHRGYDYRYSSEEGDFPWGASTNFKQVMKDLQTMWIDGSDAEEILRMVQELGWKAEEIETFSKLLSDRTISPENDPLREKLAHHAEESKNHRRPRAKGDAFPRDLMWRHLVEIVERHRDFLADPEGFLRELSIKPHEDKESSIFFYHRKTRREMLDHTASKTRKCPYAEWLGLPSGIPCDLKEKPGIRRFLLLEFLAIRMVELDIGEGVRKHLPAATVMALLDWQEFQEAKRMKGEKPGGWGEAKKVLLNGLKSAFNAGLRKQSPFNDHFIESLKDLACPSPANRRGRAGLSEAAAEKLASVAVESGYEPEKIRVALRDFGYYDKRRGATLDERGRYPQVEFLLGVTASKDKTATQRHPNRKKRGELAIPGKLHRLFEKLSPLLGGKSIPDYCVVEVIGDAPRSEKMAQEIEKEMRDRKDRSKLLFEKFNIPDNGSRTTRLKLKLWEQQRGHSPYTGKSLGTNPLDEKLEIEHIIPASKGGLFVEENLVLTWRKENEIKSDRTPIEAARDLAGDTTVLRSLITDMRWSDKKRAVFLWDQPGIPDFGNITRVSQLARQLTGEIARWLGIDSISNDTERENVRAERIGTPAGHLTATARAAWKMPFKDRTDLAHHLVDAVTLTYIPPREGMNSVAYGGIFESFRSTLSDKKRLSVLPLGPDPVHIERLVSISAPECCVEKFRRSRSRDAILDATIFGVGPDGRLWTREPLARDTFKDDAVALFARLKSSGIPDKLIPPQRKLQEWLEGKGNETLQLLNGSPIRSIAKKSGKNKEFAPAWGLHGKPNPQGGWQSVRTFTHEKSTCMEIWRTWNGKKQKWEFTTRREPDRKAMEVLLRTAFNWLSAAPDSQLLDPTSVTTLKQEATLLKSNRRRWGYLTLSKIARRLLRKFLEAGFLARDENPYPWKEFEKTIWGGPPLSDGTPVIDAKTGKPARIQNGDTFLIKVSPEGKKAEAGKTFQEYWFNVSALKGDGRVELTITQNPKKSDITLSAKDLAGLFNAQETDAPPPDTSGG